MAGVLMNVCATSEACRMELSITRLLPALLSAMSETQSPKQQKRVLMVLSFLVQRASEPQLSALTPQQLGALLSHVRTLLASPNTLEHFCALRMLSGARICLNGPYAA